MARVSQGDAGGRQWLVVGRYAAVTRAAVGSDLSDLGEQTYDDDASLSVRSSAVQSMQIQMGKMDISPSQIHEKKRKEEKYPKWQYNQVSNFWSPVFTKSMFEMANLRSATFGVPNIQFSRSCSCVVTGKKIHEQKHQRPR